jgi:hypothetical protein
MVDRKRIFLPKGSRTAPAASAQNVVAVDGQPNQNSHQFIASEDKPPPAVNLREFIDISQLIGMDS